METEQLDQLCPLSYKLEREISDLLVDLYKNKVPQKFKEDPIIAASLFSAIFARLIGHAITEIVTDKNQDVILGELVTITQNQLIVNQMQDFDERAKQIQYLSNRH